MTAIFISGTPCTGKTTIASKLNMQLIKVNDLVEKYDITEGIDKEKGYKIINIEKLNEHISDHIKKSTEPIIFEGHLTHLCSGADKVIVLRLNPEILKKRLEKRGYSKSKIQENLEAEALGVCTSEAYEIYKYKVIELDMTNLKTDEAVELVKKAIAGDVTSPPGSVEFSDWIIANL